MSIGTIGAVILLIFFFIILIYSIGSFFILYHLIRFGVGAEPKRIALLFFCGSVILLFIMSIGFLASYPTINGYITTLAQQTAQHKTQL